MVVSQIGLSLESHDATKEAILEDTICYSLRTNKILKLYVIQYLVVHVLQFTTIARIYIKLSCFGIYFDVYR